MRKLILILFCVLFAHVCNAENTLLLCRTTTTVNLREGPSLRDPVICQIPQGAYFVAILYEEDGDLEDGVFVHGLFVDKDIYGYVCIDYLNVVRELETDNGGVLSKSGETYNYDPEIEITNATGRNITVKINENTYPFKRDEVRTITCAPGSVSILASSPGVIPYSAIDHVTENGFYTWKFYIEIRHK